MLSILNSTSSIRLRFATRFLFSANVTVQKLAFTSEREMIIKYSNSFIAIDSPQWIINPAMHFLVQVHQGTFAIRLKGTRIILLHFLLSTTLFNKLIFLARGVQHFRQTEDSQIFSGIVILIGRTLVSDGVFKVFVKVTLETHHTRKRWLYPWRKSVSALYRPSKSSWTCLETDKSFRGQEGSAIVEGKIVGFALEENTRD